MALETQNFDLSALALFSLAFRSSARRMLASNDFRRATAPFLVSKYRLFIPRATGFIQTSFWYASPRVS